MQTRDLHGDRGCGNPAEPAGMETNVAGKTWGWNKIVQDSHRAVSLFDFYGAPAATKMGFQTAEGRLL